MRRSPHSPSGNRQLHGSRLGIEVIQNTDSIAVTHCVGASSEMCAAGGCDDNCNLSERQTTQTAIHPFRRKLGPFPTFVFDLLPHHLPPHAPLSSPRSPIPIPFSWTTCRQGGEHGRDAMAEGQKPAAATPSHQLHSNLFQRCL